MSQKLHAERLRQILASAAIRPLTDLGNAERLIVRHGQELRYCYEMDKWFVWTGARWIEDRAAAERKAKETARSVAEEAVRLETLTDVTPGERETVKKQIEAHAKQAESRARLYAMLDLAQSEGGVQIRAAELDANHWLFNVKNGTVDLRTGRLRQQEKADLITRMADVVYDETARAPIWESFIHDIMAGDPDMIAYLQRVVGYCLTGEVSEQCLFFLWGTGSNGKSTFTEIIMALLGELAHKSETNIFTSTRANNDGGRATPELSRLRGRRLVVTSELDAGKRVDEARVKDLTGKDTVVARGLFQDFIEFLPTHKLFVFGNHKPTIKGADYGIWRRIRLIPFTVCFTKESGKLDAELDKKMLRELPGILNWAIAGCLEWRKQGLGMPGNVKDATDSYRADMDVLGQFLRERCVQFEFSQVKTSNLYRAYTQWAKVNGEHEVSQKALGLMMQERGFKPDRTNRERYWKGLELTPFTEDTEDETEVEPKAKTPPAPPLKSDTSNKSDKPEASSAKRDASVTRCDASENERVTTQSDVNKEDKESGDACDAFCAHIHTCARARDARASNTIASACAFPERFCVFSKECEKRVTTRHASLSDSQAPTRQQSSTVNPSLLRSPATADGKTDGGVSAATATASERAPEHSQTRPSDESEKPYFGRLDF